MVPGEACLAKRVRELLSIVEVIYNTMFLLRKRQYRGLYLKVAVIDYVASSGAAQARLITYLDSFTYNSSQTSIDTNREKGIGPD